MSTRTFFLNSATTQYGEEELNSLQKFLFNQGILNTLGSSWEDWIANGDLGVIQRGAGANMSVDVRAGWSLLNTTRSAVTFKVFCQAIGTTNLVIANNVTGSNRIDAIIMRVSRSATPNTLANNVVTLEVVLGSGVSALTDGAITSAIGSDDFIRLANITVSNGASSIVTANIADTRVRAKTNNIFSLNPEVIEVKVLGADPTNLAQGMVWFNTATSTLNFYNGSTVKQLGGTATYLTGDDTVVDGRDQTQSTQDATRAVGEANSTTKNNKLAQSFTVDKSSVIGGALYKIADTGSFTGTVTIDLYLDSAGSPTGSSLATKTISNAEWLALSVGEFAFTFTSPYIATIAQKYHFVVTTSTSDNSNHPNLGTNSAGGYAGGSAKFWNTTDGWTAISTIDLWFETYTTAISKVVKTNINGKIDDSLLNSHLVSSYPLGEAFTGATTPQPAVIVNDIVQPLFDGVTQYGASGSPQIASKIIAQQGVSVGSIVTQLMMGASPATNLTIEIQTDNAGVPSNTPVTNGTSNTVAASTLKLNEYRYYNFTFSTPPVLVAGTTYHLVLKTSATNANQISVPSLSNAKKFASFSGSSYNGSAWSANQPIPYFEIIPVVAGSFSLWRSQSTGNEPMNIFDGFVTTTGNAGILGTIVKSGVVTGFSGLAIGAEYYLSSSIGVISLDKSLGVYLGTAISATSIEISSVKMGARNARYLPIIMSGEAGNNYYSLCFYAYRDGFVGIDATPGLRNNTAVTLATNVGNTFANATNPSTSGLQVLAWSNSAYFNGRTQEITPVKRGDRLQLSQGQPGGAGSDPATNAIFFQPI